MRLGFMVAALIAIVAIVFTQWSGIRAAATSVSWGWAAVSLVSATIGAALPGLVWYELLAGLGTAVRRDAASGSFFVAQLGKYLPGGVWSLAAQVDLARDMGVSRRRSAAASVIGLGIGILGGLLVASLALPLAGPYVRAHFWWVFLLAPVLLGLLHPKLVRRWSALAFRLTRRPESAIELSWPTLLRCLGWVLLSWACYGVHLGSLLIEPGADGSIWLLATGIFALAWIAGFLVVVAPAGLGIREGAMVLGFASFMPGTAVLAAALLSRAIFLIADVLLAATGFLMTRRSRRTLS